MGSGVALQSRSYAETLLAVLPSHLILLGGSVPYSHLKWGPAPEMPGAYNRTRTISPSSHLSNHDVYLLGWWCGKRAYPKNFAKAVLERFAVTLAIIDKKQRATFASKSNIDRWSKLSAAEKRRNRGQRRTGFTGSGISRTLPLTRGLREAVSHIVSRTMTYASKILHEHSSCIECRKQSNSARQTDSSRWIVSRNL